MAWRGIAAIAALAATCATAGCGSGRSTAQTSTAIVETSDVSKDEVTMKAPATLQAGRVEIELRNRGNTLHDAQLFRVDERSAAADVVHVLESADSSPKPRWLHPAGGVAPTRPGENATVTQVLRPGTYYVADTQERVDPDGAKVTNATKGGIAKIEVTGSAGGDLPGTAAAITAREYGFDSKGIVPGTNRLTFHNAGRELHQVVAFPIDDDVSFGAGQRAVLDRQRSTGWVPVDVPHRRATTVLEGGERQVTRMTFRAGRYLLLCFVSDRTGGSAQWTIGMMSKLRVRNPNAGRR